MKETKTILARLSYCFERRQGTWHRRDIPPRLTNGETLVEALTRCRRQFSMSREKWSFFMYRLATVLG